MGAGIYYQTFDGKGKALLVGGSPDTDTDAYTRQAKEALLEKGFEQEAIDAMGSGAIADHFMDFDDWCTSQWDDHTEELRSTAFDAAAEILGKDAKPAYPDHETIPDGFEVIACANDRSIFVGIRGYQHDHVVAVYSPKAIEEDPYYTGYNGEKLLCDEAQTKVIDTGLPVDVLRQFEQTKIDALFDTIRARLQETFGVDEVYKASGGYTASRFEACENVDAFVTQNKEKFDQAQAKEKDLIGLASTLSTEQSVEVCKARLDLFGLRDMSSAVYIDIHANEAVLLPEPLARGHFDQDDIELIGTIPMPEDWKQWECVQQALEFAGSNSIIELPDHGQALAWINTVTAQNVKAYDEGKYVERDHRYLYPPQVLNQAGFDHDWFAKARRLNEVFSESPSPRS